MISVHPPNFVLGLVSGITAVTFITLGVVFSIVFGTLGFVFLALGVIDAIVAVVVFAGGQYSRSLLVPSHIDFKPGETIAETYSPTDPGNFVPVAG